MTEPEGYMVLLPAKNGMIDEWLWNGAGDTFWQGRRPPVDIEQGHLFTHEEALMHVNNRGDIEDAVIMSYDEVLTYRSMGDL